MNNHDSSHNDHISLLGKNHPHKELQHDHDEVVGGKDCEGWMKEWVSWLINIPSDKNPVNNRQANPFDKGYESIKFFDESKNEGVYFFAAPTYGTSGDTYVQYYEVLPIGTFHLFIVPFMLFNSTQEYPSMDKPTLYSKAVKQVESLYEINVSLDGLSMQCCRVPIPPERSFKVNGIPEKNVLGLTREELKSANFADMVGDGYAMFLKPLEPGLHRLRYEAYSPNYALRTQIQLNVRGPKSVIRQLPGRILSIILLQILAL